MSDATGLNNSVRGLFDGIVAIFDDECEKEKSDAYLIVQYLKGLNFPVVGYSVPPLEIEKVVKNLYGASFIIFDWKYTTTADQALKEDDETPIPTPGDSELKKEQKDVQVNSLKNLLAATYCPIFIISQENINDIKNALDAAKITTEGAHPRILFCSKGDLRADRKLFDYVKDWIGNHIPVYVLKTWELAARRSKFDVFAELEPYKDWPRILWRTYKKDGDDASFALSALICRAIMHRMCFNCEFPKATFKDDASGDKVEKNSSKKIISAVRYLHYHNADAPYLPGDVFVFEDEPSCYYVNIRAACDTIRAQDAIDLYLIRCYDFNALPQDYEGLDKPVTYSGGQPYRWSKSFIIPYSIDGKTIEADFNCFSTRRINKNDKRFRVGRLLPPYLTRLQQLYSSYMIREGLPAVPDELRLVE